MGNLGSAAVDDYSRQGRWAAGGCRSAVNDWVLRIVLACLLIFAADLVLADTAELETDIKAAMLYKFLGYIDWPQWAFLSDDAPYVIGVIGADAIAEELERITEDRTVGNRAVDVRAVDEIETSGLERLAQAHLLFIGRRAEVNRKQLDELAQQHAIATVTENPRGLESVSVINLRLVNGRVGFDVSLAASERRKLKLSARMLSVASTVEKESRQ